MSDDFGLEMVSFDLATQAVDCQVVRLIPKRLAIRHRAIPVSRDGGKLVVAVADINDPFAIQDIRLATGATRIALARASEDDIVAAIERYYRD